MPKAADHTTRQEALRELRQGLARLLDVTERQRTLTGRLDQDVACLRAELRQAGDLHEVACSTREGTHARLVYLEGGADPRLVAAARQALAAWGDAGAPVLKEVSSPETASVELLQGHALLLLDRHPKAFVLATSAEPKAETTESERVVRGPSAAVSHELDNTLAALRELLRTPRLVVEELHVGTLAQSRVALVYVAGLAQPSVAGRVRTLVQRFPGPAVFDSAQLTPLFADDPLVVFPVTQATERLDTLAEGLTEGRVAVLTEGSPTAVLVPTTFANLMSSPEDRYLPRFMADFARFLRYASALLTPFFEPVYIAVTTVDRELLPTPLALAIARSRAGVPLPSFVEVLMMALIVEVLREAAVRLPNSLSQTIAIVGGLVLGQAVVQAQLVSAPVIVVVALTAMTSFLIPSYELAVTIRLVRYVGMVVAAVLGLYGVVLYALFLLAQVARLRSFGLSYLFPLSPMRPAFWRLVLRARLPRRRLVAT